MDEIDTLLETLAQNEEIAEKFFQVEVSILSSLSFKEFFEALLSETREKFLIPYVWVTFLEESEQARLIRDFASSDVLDQRLSVIDAKTFSRAVGNQTRPQLCNSDLQPFYRMLPPNETYLMRSIAVVPLTLDGEIIGSLNFGDSFGSRYSPGMDTTLLERLGVKVSVCLSNVMSHEKLRRSMERRPGSGTVRSSEC